MKVRKFLTTAKILITKQSRKRGNCNKQVGRCKHQITIEGVEGEVCGGGSSGSGDSSDAGGEADQVGGRD